MIIKSKLNKLPSQRSFFLVIAMIVTGLVLYLPYIFHGGFIVDDWGVVTDVSDLWFNYTKWFPLFSNRPLAPVYLSITNSLFRTQPIGYICSNITFWILSLVLISLSLKAYLHPRSLVIFFLLGMTPVIASSFFFSPAMQSLNTFSIFLWSISFYFISRYLSIPRSLSPKLILPISLVPPFFQFKRRQALIVTIPNHFLILSYLFVGLSLLVYEVTLPLLAINILFPILCDPKIQTALSQKALHKKNLALFKINKKNIEQAGSYIWPIISIIGMIFAYQKLIIPKFMEVYSRFHVSLSPDYFYNAIIILIYWFTHITLGIWLLLVEGVKSLPDFISITESYLLVLLSFACLLPVYLKPSSKKLSDNTQNLGIIFLISLASTSFLFILSSNRPSLSGYENRAMSTIWLTFSLLVALVLGYYRNLYSFLAAGLLLMSSFATFVIQRNQYINSYHLQQYMATDIIESLKKNKAPSRAQILANIPKYLSPNFNNELVMAESWDLSGMLLIKDPNYMVGGNTFTVDKIQSPNFRTTADKIFLDGYWSIPYNNVWYYEYNQNSNQSKLIPINTQVQLNQITQQIKTTSDTALPKPIFNSSTYTLAAEGVFRISVSLIKDYPPAIVKKLISIGIGLIQK